jgi:hypothetical protein
MLSLRENILDYLKHIDSNDNKKNALISLSRAFVVGGFISLPGDHGDREVYHKSITLDGMEEFRPYFEDLRRFFNRLPDGKLRFNYFETPIEALYGFEIDGDRVATFRFSDITYSSSVPTFYFRVIIFLSTIETKRSVSIIRTISKFIANYTRVHKEILKRRTIG